MTDKIINATGTDRIVLWKYDGKHVSRSSTPYSTWMFISGDRYDLEFLDRQLDLGDMEHQWETGKDVYGKVEGIKISGKPSILKRSIQVVESVGFSRKYMIYNGDVDHRIRFLTERNLSYFSLDDPMDFDMEIPHMSVEGMARNGIPVKISLNGKSFTGITRDALEELSALMRDSIIILYDNRDRFFSRVLQIMRNMGIGIPSYSASGASTFQSYGVTHSRSSTVNMAGKICIPMDSFIFQEAGLDGVLETSRTSFLSPGRAAVMTSGSAVSSMEEAFALQKGIMIPYYKNDHEYEKSLETLMYTDMGGLVLQPKPGLYQDVHEIDFSSMYPSIMVNFNISPETINFHHGTPVEGTPYMIRNEKGFIPSALDMLLRRRLFYKSVKHMSPVYERRDKALKWMLLTSFGYTGYKNAKFGKIEAHEAITAKGRHVLRRTMEICREMGFSVIHGIVDSLWIQGNGDMKSLLQRIESETSIGIVEEGHYRWITFLPARSGDGAMNRYFGLKHDGTYKIRGIEIRRRDSPNICKNFQTEALNILSGCITPEDIKEHRGDIKKLEARYLSLPSEFSDDDYMIGFHMQKRSAEYATNTIRKAVGRSLERRNIQVMPGETRRAMVSDGERKILSFHGDEGSPDPAYYRKLLLRAFEPVDFLFHCTGERETVQKTLMEF